MNKPIDGGSAFPTHQFATFTSCQFTDILDPERVVAFSESPGATMRDYFAARAPEAPQAWTDQWYDRRYDALPTCGPASSDEERAAYEGALAELQVQHEIDWRWHYADRMLAARSA